jgi:hypothetical protein
MSNYDGPIQIDDDSDYNNDIYSHTEGTEETTTNQYVTLKKDYNTGNSN